MTQIHIISGVERRRRWSKEQKQALVAAAFAPGATVSAIARQADIGTCLIYRWRQQLREERTGFAEVVVSRSSGPADQDSPAIEITMGNGCRMRVPSSTPPDLATAIVRALVRR